MTHEPKENIIASRSLGTLTLDLVAKIGGFERGLDQAERKSSRTAAQIVRDQKKSAEDTEKAWANVGTAIGVGFTAATTALAVWIRGSITAIDQFNDLRDVSGATIENISALDDVARRTGHGFDQVSGTLIKFNQVLNEADPAKGPGAVLKALNLDIEELKRLDPAEALRQTAVALKGFADDGSKARAAQELFGKAAKDVIPFLNDLADEQKLVGSVTTQTAVEVDKFNKELSKFESNIEDVSRSLASYLVPAFNRVFEDITTFGEKAALAGLSSDMRKFKSELDALQARKGSPFNFAADLDKEIAEASRKLEAARAKFNAADVNRPKQVGGGRGFVNPPNASTLPSLDIPEDVKPIKTPRADPAIREAQAYLENLKKQLQATEDLSVAETVLRDIQAGRLKLAGGVTEQELVGIARQIDASKALSKSLDEQKKAREANEQTQMRIDQQAFASVEAMISSNQALREEIELIGVEGQARTAIEQARISSTIALKKEELAMLKNAEASAAQISALEREIVLLAQRRDLLGQQSVRVQEVEEIKQAKEYSKELNSDLKRAFSDAFRDTKNPLKAFGESLYSTVLSRVSAALAESLATNALKSLGNGSTSGGGDWIGAIVNLFSGGFGSGSAYGNQDLGLNFEGGGYTGSGARAGGMDGKGGFMAMVHPNETVIDHTKGGFVSQSKVTVNVINQGGGNIAVTGQRQTRGADGSMNIDVMVEALQGVMADNLSNGSGSLARAMEGRYGLRTAVS